MATTLTDIKVGDYLEELLGVWTEAAAFGEPDTSFRMSESAKKARYLALKRAGTRRDPEVARSLVKMDIGTWAHDALREKVQQWGRNKGIEITHKEEELTYNIGDVVPITGHCDGVIHFGSDMTSWLMDIKTVDHYSFMSMDPKMKGVPFYKIKSASARDFTFDAVAAFENDPFKSAYLAQLAAYCEAFMDRSPDYGLDGGMFWIVNRNTGHCAASFHTMEEMEKWGTPLLVERDAAVLAAVSNPNYMDHPLCHPVVELEGGKMAPDIRCQYCPYTRSCFEVEGFGKNQVIKSIYGKEKVGA